MEIGIYSPRDPVRSISAGEPFDFRVHVQRDGEGRWSLTKLYPRVGEARPLDMYHEEGPRLARFLGLDVVKYHRTVSGYLNALIRSGFRVDRLSELKPTPEMLGQHPEWAAEVRRPMFLLVSASKS